MASRARIDYFAYGSNLDLTQMAERCPSSLFKGKATLSGYRWQINERGVANVVATPREPLHYVEGFLFSVNAADQRALDRSEGVQRGFYERKALSVRLLPHRDGPFKTTYLAQKLREGRQIAWRMDQNAASNVEALVIRPEYTVRMERAIKDALQMGVREVYVRKYLYPIVRGPVMSSEELRVVSSWQQKQKELYKQAQEEVQGGSNCQAQGSEPRTGDPAPQNSPFAAYVPPRKPVNHYGPVQRNTVNIGHIQSPAKPMPPRKPLPRDIRSHSDLFSQQATALRSQVQRRDQPVKRPRTNGYVSDGGLETAGYGRKPARTTPRRTRSQPLSAGPTWRRNSTTNVLEQIRRVEPSHRNPVDLAGPLVASQALRQR
ncbi:hypothetical protein LTR97_000837 [Elasticomyces elasticus]|uniref:gamma-glutamylcyclotransferase n=1 Tax=Elasticomyces elasticus TaxID=574655 RepID=A0AAN7WFE4_9PEZI|nr:hypothetical protein LTR97_000837 [Elasticomyces elasticus]